MTNIEEPSGAISKELEHIASGMAPIYDENGAIEPDFLADVTAAIDANDEALVRALAGRLHEADLGLLIVCARTGPAPQARRDDGRQRSISPR